MELNFYFNDGTGDSSLSLFLEPPPFHIPMVCKLMQTDHQLHTFKAKNLNTYFIVTTILLLFWIKGKSLNIKNRDGTSAEIQSPGVT